MFGALSSTINFDQLVSMVLVTSIIPIFGEVAKQLVIIIFDWITKIFNYVTDHLYKYNTVTIKKISRISNIISDTDDQVRNGVLINSVLDYVNKRGITSNSTELVLNNDGTGRGNNSFHKTSTMLKIPKKHISVDGFVIEYEKIENIIKSKNANGIETIHNEGDTVVFTYLLTISSKKSIELINKFVDDCYRTYVDKIYPLSEDERQYFFSQSPNMIFARYNLVNTTTFNDIFFPQKDEVIELLTKLESGKLSKLGLFLSGLPGCGKSSLIRAIAHHTGRNIVAVKLSLIKTDEDIMNLFFSEHIMLKDKTYQLIPINKRIYALEDFDAETDIIETRKSDCSSPNSCSGSSSSANELLAKALIQATDKTGKTNNDVSNKWTLSGFLNAIDGIMQLNGPIIVFTTNHPEKIDPAVYRYGRVNAQINMTKMKKNDAIKLITKFFDDCDQNIKDILVDDIITPSHLEALCQKTKNLTELRQQILDLN